MLHVGARCQFNERQIFERCNPAMLRRRPLNGMDSAEVGRGAYHSSLEG